MLAMKPVTMSFLTGGACGGGSNMPWAPESFGGGGSSTLGVGTGNACCDNGGGNNGNGGDPCSGDSGSGSGSGGLPTGGGGGGGRGPLGAFFGGGRNSLDATKGGVVYDRYCLAGGPGNLPQASANTCYSASGASVSGVVCIGPAYPQRPP